MDDSKKEYRGEKIGEILIKWGFLTQDKLTQALEYQQGNKKKIGEILIEQGFINEQQLTEALAHENHLPVIELSSSFTPDEKLLNLFSFQLLNKHKVLPIEIKGDSLTVATSDPLDVAVFEELHYLSGYRIKLVMAGLHDIEASLNKYFGAMRQAADTIKEIIGERKDKEAAEKETTGLKELETAAQEVPVVKLVNSILSEAVKQCASDVHIEPQRVNLRVRFRIDGVLYEKVIVPRELQAAVISRIKIISGMDIAERRKPQDGRMSLKESGREIDLRVSTLPDIFGEKIVLRLLDRKSILRSLDDLGMDEKEHIIMKSLIYKPYGIILVTGPTGAGKTTTLYSMLNTLNDATRNIITVEDPVEYELDGINQTHINVKAGYTFATAIRHILRQDPDVIMIGEIRDLETAEIAVQAALTGHLVLSTLHTNTAPGAITRLMDMDVEPFLISSAVIGVIAQRLVRKLCPFCKQDYDPSPQLIEEINNSVPLTDKVTLAKPAGCDKCFNMGYSGRIGIYEIFTMNDELRQLILKRSNEQDIVKIAVKHGMDTLKMAGIKKVLKRTTSLEEVARVTFVDK